MTVFASQGQGRREGGASSGVVGQQSSTASRNNMRDKALLLRRWTKLVNMKWSFFDY